MRRYLAASMLLLLATVHFYPGGWDDSIAMVHATTGLHFLGYPYGNSLGFHWMLNALFSVLGHHLDLYRIWVMTYGLYAYMYLDLAAESKWATIGLAALLWTPITFESFHMIRYDTLQLALLGLTAFWMTDTADPLFGLLLGLGAGLCPFISLSGLLTLPAVYFTLLSQKNAKATALWTIGAMIGGIWFMHSFPADTFVQELLSMPKRWGAPLQPAGILMLGHPWYCLKTYVMGFGWNQSGMGMRIDPFYLLMLYFVVRTFKTRILSRFAFFYSISHFLFCMSRYPALLDPLMVAAGLSAWESL